MSETIVKSAIARISRKPVARIEPHLTLASLGVNASVGLSALQNVLEAETGRKLPPLQLAMSAEDIVALISGQAPAKPAADKPMPTPAALPSHAPLPLALGNFGLGMDLQQIADLPQTCDFRDEPFYNENFRPEEIAGALLRPDPRQHLCGIFCAKEAARKSHPRLIGLRMNELRVIHDAGGRPQLEIIVPEGMGLQFNFMLSITHSGDYAAATCLSAWSAA